MNSATKTGLKAAGGGLLFTAFAGVAGYALQGTEIAGLAIVAASFAEAVAGVKGVQILQEQRAADPAMSPDHFIEATAINLGVSAIGTATLLASCVGMMMR